MAKPVLKPSQTAFIIIDVQQAFSEMAASGHNRNNPAAEQRIADLLQTFRTVHAPIFHIRHRNVAPQSRFNPQNSGFSVQDCARERDGEPVIVKDVNSAFIGTDLEPQLRQAGIDTLVIVGATTNHCVETTTRMAGNMGFTAYLVDDATWTFDRAGPDGKLHAAQDIHQMSLANLHDEFCTVIKSVGIIEALALKP